VAIVGGGFIGCEYASIFGRLGVDVTLIEALPRLLPLEDAETSSAIEKALSKQAKILTNTRVESADKAKKTITAAGAEIHVEKILMAVGRAPLMPEGLDRMNVAVEKSGIRTDSRMRTNVPGIYAVGDAACGLKLAHVAYEGGETAAKNIMGRDCVAVFEAVPWCVYTQPEIGRVGITEAEAKGDVKVGRADYLANGKARCMGERGGFCKVIVERENGTLLGVHIVGAHASSLIGEAALAIRNKMTAKQVTDTIHPHPSLPELLKEACRDAQD
jgi:dihydrolipoamide dehydrogenase